MVYGGGYNNVDGGKINKTNDNIKCDKRIVNGDRGAIKWKITILISFNYIYRMFGRCGHGKNGGGIGFRILVYILVYGY